ncbi:Reproductive homeobox 7B [Apodemus speciosus]|uniref:Reproductive homeobox 7B n=1 Tax=Apodemus speciosus TaxID=105296 RepID=A0ABQ0FU20_APOSI
MEPPCDYDEDSYHYLEDYEQDRGSPSEQGAAVAAGGTASDDHPSQDNSEKQQGKLDEDYMSPEKDLDPEGDQRDQEPMDADQEEPAFPRAVKPKRQGRRHQIPFSFTQWQVQEMERMFQETEYPDVLTRCVGGARPPGARVHVELTFTHLGLVIPNRFPDTGKLCPEMGVQKVLCGIRVHESCSGDREQGVLASRMNVPEVKVQNVV